MSAGLELLDSEGHEALTMRRLAQELGVTPMALYNHVSDKRDLLRGVAEHAISGVDFSCDQGDWRARVRLCFSRLRQTCLAHPGIVRLLETVDVAPLTVFRPMEVTLGALADAGLRPVEATRAFFLLANFTMGQVSYETRGPFDALDPAEALRSGRLSGPPFQNIRRSLPPGSWDFDRAFEFGLSTILAGLERLADGRCAPGDGHGKPRQ